MKARTVIAITGSAGAIGQALIRKVKRRCDIIPLDLTAGDEWAGDVASESDQIRWSRLIAARYGRIDGLVCAAGVEGRPELLTEMSADEIRRVLDINVVGTALSIKHLGPLCKVAGHGSIVTLASTSGLIGNPAAASYVASKHAVIGLTRSAAAEYGPLRVRVNCVAPGPLASPMMEAFAATENTEGAVEWYIANTPLGRLGKPSEIAAVIAFLLSSAASYVTGAVLTCDGGLLATGRPATA